MTIFRTLLLIWVFWWLAKKILNYFGNSMSNKTTNYDNNDRSEEFKRRNMDVQDAEYEEIDESR